MAQGRLRQTQGPHHHLHHAAQGLFEKMAETGAGAAQAHVTLHKADDQ